MQHAHEHIMTNMELLSPGIHMRDLTFKSHALDKNFQKGKYGCLMHGVGLCDEWPLISYPDKFVEGAYNYVLEPGMVLCVEALVSPENGDFSIKLEDQVLITESGYENLTKPHIQDEIQRLKGEREKRIELTADKVLEDIERVRQKAEGSEQYTVSLKASELQGKHLAMFTEKHKVDGEIKMPVVQIELADV